VAEAYGRDDSRGVLRIYLTGIVVLAAVGVVLFVAALPFLFRVHWAGVFKVGDTTLARQVPLALGLAFGAFCLGLPLGTAQKLAAGLQLGWISGLWLAAGSLLSLVLIALAAAANLSFVPFIGLAILPPVLINPGLGWHLLRQPELADRAGASIDWQSIVPLLRQGLSFLVPQIGAAILFSLPPVIIAAFLGPSEVTPYNLCQRVFGLASQVQMMLLIPLWPAFAEAKARDDYAWIRHAFLRSVAFSVGFGLVACLALALTGRTLIEWWVAGRHALPSPQLVALFAAWTFVLLSAQPCSFLLNGLGLLTGQMIYGPIACAAALGAMVYAAPRFGLEGVAATLLLSYALLALPWTYAESFHALRVREGRACV
jgi:O-antigen/teichoic acid export membrane protein